MERVPVVNKKDEKIDETTREICHAKKLRHRGIHIFIFNKKGEILLQKRSNSKDEYPSYYEASVSGHVLAHENYDDAVLREMEEELGITVSINELQKIKKFEMFFGNEHLFVQLYVLFTKKKPKIHDGEVESFQWISKPNLVKLIKQGKLKFTPEFLAALEQFMNKK
ncbi:NUDIX domain-containing protein [Candidatus Woesearchaeota archaeon]|nr:NUDIX domain-containing protein [Candidatus Woesearchaeota archaeon]